MTTKGATAQWMGLALLALATTGCAHRGAMRVGDSYARYGEWDKALDAYEEAAQRRPGSAAVARRIERATSQLDAERAEAVRIALVDAEQALLDRDYDQVATSIRAAFAADPGNELARELGWEASVQLVTLARALAGTGAWQDAWPLAALAVELSPGDLVATELFADVQREAVAELTRDADGAERSGEIGAAMLYHARAAALSGDPDHVRARDRLSESLMERHRFDLRWSPQPAARSEAIRGEVLAALGADDRIRLVDSGRSDLHYTIDTPAATCSETSTVRAESVQVRTGTIEVDNPEWARRKEETREARERAEVAAAELRQREASLGAAERALHWFMEVDWRVTGEELGRKEADVDEARTTWGEASEQLAAAQQALRDSEERRVDATRELAMLERTLAAAETSLVEAQEDLEHERRRIRTARARLEETPRTVEEGVYETFRYPVADWTRTCIAESTATVHTQKGEAWTWAFESTASTTDSTHLAYPEQGVAGNPLSYPRSDSSLIADGDDEIAGMMRDALRHEIDAYHVDLWESGLAASNRDAAWAAELLLAGHLLDPARGHGELATFLSTAYRIDDVDWLTETW